MENDTYAYEALITELNEKYGIDKNEFFVFEGTPHENKCTELFHYFQKSFYKDFSSMGIEPAFFYYNNNRDINGYATRMHDCYIVCFHIGAVHEIWNKIGDLDLTPYHKNDSSILEVLWSLNPKGTNKLIYSSAMMYFFYHEVGHLVQLKSEGDNRNLLEKENINIYTKEKHLREIDADMFAAIQLSRQILNRLDKSQATDVRIIYTLFGIYLSGPVLFNLFLLSMREFYTTDHSHPHPFVRMLCIINSMIIVMHQKYPDINIDDFIFNCLEIPLEIVDDVIKHERGRDYEISMKEMFCKNESDIRQYSKLLIDHIPTMQNSAVNEYNRVSRNLNR